MRYLSLLLTALVLLSTSCEKNDPATKIPLGTYKGSFQRFPVGDISNVTLNLSLKNFEGTSQTVHYPAICKGTYFTNGDSASFESECFYTADFDWTYILSGKYKFLVFGDSLILSREYGNLANYEDIYRLKKQ